MSAPKRSWCSSIPPMETIRERVARRNMHAANDAFTISGELLDVYLQYWESPSDDEDYVLAGEVR